jgi:glutathione S-transferase
MLVVHHLGISQSERIVWLCEELAIPYTLKRYDRDPVTRLAPADYKALHPAGTAPVIEDGETVMAESGAIVEYIVAKYGQGRLSLPPSDPEFANFLFWLHFANASMGASEMIRMVVSFVGAAGDHPAMRFVNDRSQRAYAQVEARLGQAPFFAGEDLTAADIMMVFTLTTLRAFSPHDFGEAPNTLAYLKRIGERPAYQRAIAKGDPGMRPLLT